MDQALVAPVHPVVAARDDRDHRGPRRPVLRGSSGADHLDPGELRNFDPTGFSLNGIFLAQLAVGVLGVLVIASEYATGQIRATFGATPQRNLVLAAKVLVFIVVVFVVGLVACFSAFFIGQAILGGSSRLHNASLGDPGAFRAVIGGAMYLAVIGALGIGLGTILRRTAGAIAALVGLLLILPILVNFLPSPWNTDISKYLPLSAGNNVFHTAATASTDLSLWVGSPSSAPTPSHHSPSGPYSSPAATPNHGTNDRDTSTAQDRLPPGDL